MKPTVFLLRTLQSTVVIRYGKFGKVALVVVLLQNDWVDIAIASFAPRNIPTVIVPIFEGWLFNVGSNPAFFSVVVKLKCSDAIRRGQDYRPS